MNIRDQKGFTIFELILVLAIIGVLASVLYPRMQNRDLVAKIHACQTDMDRIYQACDAWKSNRGLANFTGLTYAALGTAGLWDTNKSNPWGSPYSISLDNTGGTNASVLVKSGTLPDTTTRDQLKTRYDNRSYATSVDTVPSMSFRAPF